MIYQKATPIFPSDLSICLYTLILLVLFFDWIYLFYWIYSSIRCNCLLVNCIRWLNTLILLVLFVDWIYWFYLSVLFVDWIYLLYWFYSLLNITTLFIGFIVFTTIVISKNYWSKCSWLFISGNSGKIDPYFDCRSILFHGIF